MYKILLVSWSMVILVFFFRDLLTFTLLFPLGFLDLSTALYVVPTFGAIVSHKVYTFFSRCQRTLLSCKSCLSGLHNSVRWVIEFLIGRTKLDISKS